MHKFTYYSQHDSMDCGPTCVRMIAKYYGKSVLLQNLKSKSGIGKDGVNMFGISQTAEYIGFRTTGVKLSFDELISEATLPCIAYFDQEHFVVVTKKISHSKIQIADPAQGLIELDKNTFISKWASTSINNEEFGMVLLLEPTASFYDQENEKNKGIGWSLLSKYTFKYKAQIIQLFLGLLIGSLLYPLHQPLVFLQIIRVHLWRYGFKNNGTDNAGSYCIV